MVLQYFILTYWSYSNLFNCANNGCRGLFSAPDLSGSHNDKVSCLFRLLSSGTVPQHPFDFHDIEIA